MAEDYDGEIVEMIEKDKLRPLNDPKCRHLRLKRGTDRIGDAVDVGCLDCPVGWFLPEKEAKKLHKIR